MRALGILSALIKARQKVSDFNRNFGTFGPKFATPDNSPRNVAS